MRHGAIRWLATDLLARHPFLHPWHCFAGKSSACLQKNQARREWLRTLPACPNAVPRCGLGFKFSRNAGWLGEIASMIRNCIFL